MPACGELAEVIGCEFWFGVRNGRAARLFARLKNVVRSCMQPDLGRGRTGFQRAGLLVDYSPHVISSTVAARLERAEQSVSAAFACAV